MALLEISEVVPLLSCPRCGRRVEETADGFACSSDACVLSAPGSFPRNGRRPVLVDFEASVLERPRQRPAPEPAGPSRWPIQRLPRPLRSLWKPRNRVAERNLRRLLDELVAPAPLVLVVGGATIGNGVEALYEDPRARVVAFDIAPTDVVQFVADAHQVPLADSSVDAIVIQAVLEHVLAPDRVVAEIHRLLRPSGLVYAETPFLQPVHAAAHDFTRYTSSGHRWLFRAFEEIAAGPVAGPGTQLLTSIDHLVRGLFRSELAGKLARLAGFWLRYLDRLVPDSYAMDDASAYYFLGRRSERQLGPKEIVSYYRGIQGDA